MKRLLIPFLFIVSVLMLTACGDDEGDAEEGSNDTTEEDEAAEESTDEVIKEFNDIIVDTDTAKVTLVNVEKHEDPVMEEEYYLINVEIENYHDKTIEVQTREFSMDGKMQDDLAFFSETVSADKSSDASIRVHNYDGDLPELEDNFEFIMIILEEENYDRLEEEDIYINVK